MWLGYFLDPSGRFLGNIFRYSCSPSSSDITKLRILIAPRSSEPDWNHTEFGSTPVLSKFSVCQLGSFVPPSNMDSLAHIVHLFMRPMDICRPPMVHPSEIARQNALATQDWMSRSGTSSSVAVVESNIQSSPGYAQIHGDGSSKRKIGGSFASVVVRYGSFSVIKDLRSGFIDGASSHSMELFAQMDGLCRLPLDMAAVDMFCDNSAWVIRTARMIRDYLDGFVPNSSVMSRWSNRRDWNCLIWHLRNLRSRIRVFHWGGHQSDSRMPTVYNNWMDSSAGAEYSKRNRPVFADVYFPAFELDAALCNNISAIGSKLLSSLLKARDGFHTHNWTSLMSRGAFLSSALDDSSSRPCEISSWSWDHPSSAFAAASLLRTRCRIWWTHSRMARFHTSENPDDPPKDPHCPKCLEFGCQVIDDTEHSMSCPHDKSVRSKFACSWFRSLEFGCPGLWIRLAHTPTSSDLHSIVYSLSSCLPVDSPVSLECSRSLVSGVHIALDGAVAFTIAASRLAWLAISSCYNTEAVVSAIQWGVDNCDELCKNGWTTPYDLMDVLIRIWNVQGELCSCSLNASPLLQYHVSGRQQDTVFDMIYDIFSLECRLLVRSKSGISWLLNPPYNEGISSQSSEILEKAIDWAVEEAEFASLPDSARDVTFLLLIPYERGKPSYKAIQRKGSRARVIARFPKSTALRFDRGSAWRLSDDQWKFGSGSSRYADFSCALIEIASDSARARHDVSTYTDANAARLLQWCSANQERGSASGIKLSPLWPGTSSSVWDSLKFNISWVADCFHTPIRIPSLFPGIQPPISGTLTSDVFSWKEEDWRACLIPKSLEIAPFVGGWSNSKRWKRAVLSVITFWSNVESSRRVPSMDVPELKRLRRVGRQTKAAAKILSTLSVQRVDLYDRITLSMGPDLGRVP